MPQYGWSISDDTYGLLEHRLHPQNFMDYQGYQGYHHPSFAIEITYK